MRVALTERFQRDVAALSAAERAAAFDALLALPKLLGDPHAHAGIGLRKLHRSGIWEARVGLSLRLVFALDLAGTLTLARIGTHEEIRRYLRSL
jgi:mRNA-degrading endonuclease YafQ of YafQ-DinJ toxin-antitoxin module